MKKLVLTLSVASLLVGYASYDNRNFTGLNAVSEDTRLGSSVVFLPVCPSQISESNDGEESPAILPTLITAATSIGSDFLTGTLVKSIESSKSELNGEFIASGVIPKDELEAGGCLILARGLYGKLNKTVQSDDRRITNKLLEMMKLADYPAFYLETAIVKEGSTLVSTPIYLSYASQIGKNKGSGYKNLSVVIGMSNSVAGSSEKVKEIPAVFRHDFGRLKVGGTYSDETLFGTASSQTGVKNLNDSINVNVLVTDSEKASVALEALTDSFSNNKSDIKSFFAAALNNALKND